MCWFKWKTTHWFYLVISLINYLIGVKQGHNYSPTFPPIFVNDLAKD